MQYTADELKGAGTFIKNRLLAGGEYTFYLYRPPNQTGVSLNLNGSGYFTYETIRDANGFYTSPIEQLPSFPAAAAGTHENADGANTLVSSSYIFSYELNTNGSTPQTSSFTFTPDIDIPNNGVIFRATGDYEMEVSPETEACGIQQEYQGGQAYPTHLQSILGSGTGNPILTPTPQTIPDRWRVDWNGNTEIDTGYISDSPALFNVGGAQRNNFQQALLGRTAPEGGTYPLTPGGTAPNVIASDGYPVINAIGTYTFSKDTSTPVADVFVYGPMDNTLWFSTLSCP
tara:strand:+ start:243 stop:1103 length:861 start_codon:yes stop_codon:yes gene_type:complete